MSSSIRMTLRGAESSTYAENPAENKDWKDRINCEKAYLLRLSQTYNIQTKWCALYCWTCAVASRYTQISFSDTYYSLLQRKSLGNESFQRVGDVEVRFLVANLLPSITSNSFPIKWHFILCDSAKANNTVPWWLDYLINKFEFVFFEFNSR